MQLLLINKNELHKLNLPKIISGVYWIKDDNNEKLINIDGSLGSWIIKSNSDFKLIDINNINIENKDFIISNENYLDSIKLEEYGTYGVLVGDENLYILFCLPIYENTYLHFNLKYTREFTIGSDINNSITSANKFIIPNHVKIYISNGKWILENNFFGVFINDVPVEDKPRALVNGDVILIMNLKMIFMKNTIYIANPSSIIQFDKNIFELVEKNNEDFKITEPDDDNADIELYNEKDYFSRAPRIIKRIETETIKIDAPPNKQSNEQMPAILVLGSSLSMSAIMLVSVLQSIDSLSKGEFNRQTIISLVVAGLMLITMLLFPILQLKYSKKQRIKYEKKRQERYKKYINSKISDIDKIMVKQKEILVNNYSSSEDCTKIISTRGDRLWERKNEDRDFLEVKLGIGDVPLDIQIQYPEKGFEMEDDNLVDILNTVGQKSTIIKDAPIIFSLYKNNNSAIISEDINESSNFLKSLILQLITFHDYNELKLVFLVNKENSKIWQELKMLPHVWSNSKDIRFFADNIEDMKDISYYLEKIIEDRMIIANESEIKFNQHYLIITDDFKSIEKLKIISNLLKTKNNVGFSLLSITDDLMKLPNECKTFINLQGETGTILESEISSANQKQTKFKIEEYSTIRFDNISRILSNIPIKYVKTNDNETNDLPSLYTFLEMYGVGTIEQLNIEERWRKNDSTLSLKAPVGIDNSRNDNKFRYP